ncbi:MAG TPA: M20/M25/M40 family metallo-hydrolase [Acidimicrobiia bacterium]|nr:M20/M25/M40 family metallo-hydrolase [Acidimicrobiia bacterium]
MTAAAPVIPSIVDLARRLVAIPSQGGVDPPAEIIDAVAGWLAEHDLPPSVLMNGNGESVGLSVDIGSGTGPRFGLNACLDTAPFGDLGAWSSPPTGAAVRDGWLVGRGAADSKIAIAIFAHLGVELAAQAEELAGTLVLLFDADEHTGRFGGIRAYTDSSAPLDGVMIGYPGLDEIVVGARGFWRARVHVSGRSAHSGSRRPAVANAVVKAAELVTRLNAVDLPADERDAVFPLGPKITVTGIAGGEGHSVVPDRCSVSVDIRLTPTFDAAWAEAVVRKTCASVDDEIPGRRPTVVEPDGTWPAYRLPETSRLAVALQTGARQALGRDVPCAVAGPSNIGNLLATLGTEATCGFGVAYRNLHGPDEAIDLSSVPAVYDAYLRAVQLLLGTPLNSC